MLGPVLTFYKVGVAGNSWKLWTAINMSITILVNFALLLSTHFPGTPNRRANSSWTPSYFPSSLLFCMKIGGVVLFLDILPSREYLSLSQDSPLIFFFWWVFHKNCKDLINYLCFLAKITLLLGCVIPSKINKTRLPLKVLSVLETEYLCPTQILMLNSNPNMIALESGAFERWSLHQWN